MDSGCPDVAGTCCEIPAKTLRIFLAGTPLVPNLSWQTGLVSSHAFATLTHRAIAASASTPR